MYVLVDNSEKELKISEQAVMRGKLTQNLLSVSVLTIKTDCVIVWSLSINRT